MKAVLRLELIADNLYEYARLKRAGRITRPLRFRQEVDVIRFARRELRPWVARVLGADAAGRLQREFVRYQTKDFTSANREGSRGVYVYYTLSPGIYEVNERVAWERARRYFVRVDGATITEIPREEVDHCLNG